MRLAIYMPTPAAAMEFKQLFGWSSNLVKTSEGGRGQENGIRMIPESGSMSHRARSAGSGAWAQDGLQRRHWGAEAAAPMMR